MMYRTILSINRNESMNYLLQTVLSDKYSFIAAKDVFSGMEIIKKNDHVSLIIVDTDHVEENDAWDFIELVTTSGLYQKPVIVLTSDQNLSLNGKTEGSNVDEIIVKPFSPSDLLRKIDKMIFSDKEIVNN